MTRFPQLTLHDYNVALREYRITDNENIKKINAWQDGLQEVEQVVAQANLNTSQAVSTANEAKTHVDSLDTEVDAIVQRATDSDAMSRQAAVNAEGEDKENLKVRIDDDYTNVTTSISDQEERLDARLRAQGKQLNDQGVPILPNGKVQLPEDFPELPFSIYKKGYGHFESDATPYNQLDWSEATEVFIQWEGSTSGDGTSARSPIRLDTFASNVSAGVYGSADRFILSVLDYLYVLNTNSSNGMTLNMDVDVLIRPKNTAGYTWFGRMKSPVLNTYTSAWVQSGGDGVWKTVQSNDHDVMDVINFAFPEETGRPAHYTKVTSLAACQSQVGSFYRTGTDVYCHPFPGHEAEDLVLIVATSVINVEQLNARTTIFHHIGFAPSAYRTGAGGSTATKFFYFHCTFHKGLTNGFYQTGTYQTFLFDCVSSKPTLDAFNYHTESEDSLAVEVNCIGYGAGRHKLTSGQPTHSNNGSTAHDGMHMLRVGSRYWDCEGPIVADADNCYSISIGTEASDISESHSGGVKAAYYVYDRESTTIATAKPKYILECKGYGTNVDRGIVGTAKTYVADFVGVQETEGDIQEREAFTW